MSDSMPASTSLKYSRFRGDGSQDVDDWLFEFESIVLANQEDLKAKRRTFQGLQKGEALKWYQDIPDRNRNDLEEPTESQPMATSENGVGTSGMPKASSEQVRQELQDPVCELHPQESSLDDRSGIG